jgi:hypothetical protein
MRRGQRKIPETDAWVRGIYRVKYENSAGGGRYLSTSKSRFLGIERGRIPPDAALLPLGTVYRVARELRLSPWEMGLGGG